MKEAAIEEEGLLGMDDDGYGGGRGGGWSGIPRRVRYGILFVGAFFGLFFFFALILWGASRNQRPVVTLHSATFHRFVVQAGTDASLVPTEMASLNATVRLTFRNTGTFFGVHVSAEPVTLYYTQLQLAAGNVSLLIPLPLPRLAHPFFNIFAPASNLFATACSYFMIDRSMRAISVKIDPQSL